MSKLKLVKKIFMEGFQWAAFSLPIFVTGQRFASKECPDVCPGEDNTEYWLLIAGIIAYVAGVTLVVWLPVKVFIVWKKVIRPYEGLWFPGNLLYVLFSAAPCVAFVLMGHEYCIENDGQCFDYFRGAPMETFVIMLVVTDWSEKLRYIKLRSVNDSMRENKYTSASLDRGRSVRTHDPMNHDSGNAFGTSRRSSISQKSSLHPGVRNGTWRQRLARSMKWTDARPENLLRDVMLAYDIRVLLDLSLITLNDGTTVFASSWIYPIYILSVISFFPLVLAPNSEMRSCVTVLLQDIPFFIFRIAIFCHFGSDLVLSTSVLFLMKNFFVTFAFFYFNAIVPWRDSKKKAHEYELRRFSEKPRGDYTRPNGDAFDPQADVSAYPAEIGERNPHVSPVAVELNPAYQSRRYDSPRPLRREYDAEEHYQDAEWDEHYNQEPRITSVEAGAMYASHHTSPNPQSHLVLVESVVHRVPETYTEDPHIIPQNQYLGDVNRDVQHDVAPANPPKPEKIVINFDTLHDPNSFLYNQDAAKKPRVYDIEFERPSSMTEPPIGQSSSQERNTPEKTSEGVPSTAPSTEAHARGYETDSGEVTGSNLQRQDPANSVTDPPYSQSNYTKKSSRRKAPPPPTQASATAKSSPRPNDSADTLPPPPPEILNEQQPPLSTGAVSRSSSTKYHPPKRTNSYCTPTLARRLASEVLKRNEERAAMDAVKALDEAAEYGYNIGKDWSGSTTPQSTYSVKPPLNISFVNDEEYDERL